MSLFPSKSSKFPDYRLPSPLLINKSPHSGAHGHNQNGRDPANTQGQSSSIAAAGGERVPHREEQRTRANQLRMERVDSRHSRPPQLRPGIGGIGDINYVSKQGGQAAKTGFGDAIFRPGIGGVVLKPSSYEPHAPFTSTDQRQTSPLDSGYTARTCAPEIIIGTSPCGSTVTDSDDRGEKDEQSRPTSGVKSEETSPQIGGKPSTGPMEGVKQVATVPLRNKKQAEVTYTVRAPSSEPEQSLPGSSPRPVHIDLDEIKLNDGADDIDAFGPDTSSITGNDDTKTWFPRRCCCCCHAGRKKDKYSVNETKESVSWRRAMFWHRTGKLIKTLLSVMFTLLGILVGLALLIGLAYQLSTR